MTNDPHGGRDPLVTTEQLHDAMAALGVKMGDGPHMPYAKALGALLFCVEQLHLLEADQVNAAEVRSGYINMALMAGMSMEDEEMPAGVVMPGAEVTGELWEATSFAVARLFEHRLTTILADMEEMVDRQAVATFAGVYPVLSWLRAVCTLTPMLNAGAVRQADVLKAAKAAQKHAVEGRQRLADLMKIATRGAD